MHNPFQYRGSEILKVEKLRQKLKKLPPNMKVCVRNKYVNNTDSFKDYVIHDGNSFESSDGSFCIYF